MKGSAYAVAVFVSLLQFSFASSDSPSHSSNSAGCLLSSKSLSRCLQAAERRTVACDAGTTFSQKKASCLCNAYAQRAACWTMGHQCLEWRPTVIEADKMCALSAKGKKASSKAFRALVREAATLERAIADGGGGGAVVPTITNNISHKYRPRWTHRITPSVPPSQHPLGVDPPLEVSEVEGDLDPAFLALQVEEDSIFESALDWTDKTSFRDL